MRLGPLGGWELLVILVVILLIFGPSRLPKMARGIGEMVREFRNEFRVMKHELDGDQRGPNGVSGGTDADAQADRSAAKRSSS